MAKKGCHLSDISKISLFLTFLRLFFVFQFECEIFDTLKTDLKEAIIGIAYPVRKKAQADKEDGENLVESLRKLILEKFENNHNEFYEWSRTIHDEVNLFFTCQF